MTRWPKRKWLNSEISKTVTEVINYYIETEDDLPSQSHFEKIYCDNFSLYQGGGFSDAVNSGTSAIYIAIQSLKNHFNDSDEAQIVCSPVTDFGTVSAITLSNYKLIIPDSLPNSYNTSLAEIKKIVTPETKGMVLTHSAGDPIKDIQEIQKFCKERKIWLIEDCSQAHGALVENQKVGTFSDISAFSTMHSKNHSTGGAGGLLFTKNKELYKLIRSYSDRGKSFHLENLNTKDPSQIRFPALNFSTNEISCAIGNYNLKHLDNVIKKRREFLTNLDETIRTRALPLEVSISIENSSPYFCPLKFNLETNRISEVKRKLVLMNFPCNPTYPFLVSEWPWANSSIDEVGLQVNVKHFRDSVINLHFNENFSDDELNGIINLLEECLK